MNERRRFLQDLLLDIVSDSDLRKEPDGRTFCNLAVNRVCIAFGIFCFEGKLANNIVAMLEEGLEGWDKVKPSEAVAHAMVGGLAIVGKQAAGHGHIAVVWPAAMVPSGKYGKNVPMIANVGEKNGIMSMSEAFAATKGEPAYWAYKG